MIISYLVPYFRGKSQISEQGRKEGTPKEQGPSWELGEIERR